MTDYNELSKEITKLTEVWYELVNIDHHKDRDCHWSVTVTWSYGDAPKFTLDHEGYVHERIHRPYPTMRSAMLGLRDELKRAIANQKQWAQEILESEEDYFSRSEAQSVLDVLSREGLNE